MGVEAGRVFKTLVTSAISVSTGSALVVAVVPVPAMLDMKALALAIGAKRVEMADPAAAERSTGYLVGAISPIGQKRRLATVLDESALDWETIFCSAGRRGLEVEAGAASAARGHEGYGCPGSAPALTTLKHSLDFWRPPRNAQGDA